MRDWWPHERRSDPRGAPDMNQHNPKRALVLVLLAGGALAGLAMKSSIDGAGLERSTPALAEIPSSLDSTPGEGEVVRSYKVTGMCCESCTHKLHARVTDMEGVEACAIDLEEERLILIASGDLAPESILTRLSFDKYTAVELP